MQVGAYALKNLIIPLAVGAMTLTAGTAEHQSSKRLFRKRRSRLPSRTKDTRSKDIARRAH